MVPLIMKKIRGRAPDDTDTFSGKRMDDIVAEWTQKLQGCYECLKEQKWQCPGTAKVTAANNEAEKAAKEADRQHQAAMAYAAKLAPTQEAQAKADAHFTEMLDQMLVVVKTNDEAQIQAHERVVETAKQALQTALLELWDVQGMQNLHEGAAHKAELEASKWQQAASEALVPWKPTLIPFLLSWDNCPSYSLYADSKQDTLLPIVSITQVPLHTLECL